MKCAICNKNEANQTGAHIFPAWMIASAFDGNARNRNYEIIYTLKPHDTAIPYFGSSILPDKINEHLGRDITDDEIKEQHHLLVVDNIWCRECESRIKVTEDYFLEKVERKSIEFHETESISVVEIENPNIYLIRLFIYTLILRAALTNFMEFSLNKKALTKIKSFVNKYLKTSLRETIDTIESSNKRDQLLKYPIRCIKTEQQDGDTSNFVYYYNELDKPYSFVINRYIIQFYGKGNHVNYLPETFFGICELIKEVEEFKNYKEDNFLIGLMHLNKWNEIKASFVNYYTNQRMESYIHMYKYMFKRKLGFHPDRNQIARFLTELTENDLDFGIKYTLGNIVAAMNRSIVLLLHNR